ncbi:DUF397 domain-containing protein [Nocardiopsis sp. RV163]|uniref:DUF397 domain-containing protein n=1 Tax=Nocardiopsis sp. RV163 TaxID=1661388 RepID=UPI0009E28322|nr:DUF397 domain-containing protein [Nocardiopsis sp. RV163]
MNGWHKSSYSPNGSNCAEAREHAAGVDVRGTQNREPGRLEFAASEWTALVDSLKHHG